MNKYILTNANSYQFHHFIIHWLAILCFPVTFILFTFTPDFSYKHMTDIVGYIIWMSVFSTFIIFHTRLGIENILQDYIHNIYTRQLCMFFFDVAFIFLLSYTLLFF